MEGREAPIAFLSDSACHFWSGLICVISVASIAWSGCFFSSTVTLRALLAALAAINVAAFASLVPQVDGLISSSGGILPLSSSVSIMQERLAASNEQPLRSPLLYLVLKGCVLFWRGPWSDRPSLAAYAGLVVSVLTLLVTGLWFVPASGMWRLPYVSVAICAVQSLAFLLLFVMYNNFKLTGRDFLNFQWDALLLECNVIGVVGSWACSRHTPLAATLTCHVFRICLFKLMFSSGICKFASSCPKWANHTAMHYHYFTQPLPNPVSWFAHWGPMKAFQCYSTHFLQCLLPIAIFGERFCRLATFVGFTLLMVLIGVTGNYGFFNGLTVAISISLLDDGILKAIAGERNGALLRSVDMSGVCGDFRDLMEWRRRGLPAAVTCLVLLFMLVYVCGNSVPLFRVWRRYRVAPPDWCLWMHDFLAPISLCNSYGLFANMTTSRFEMVFEELHEVDGQMRWVEVDLYYKPGAIDRTPPCIAFGHLPRLDWRLWFVPLRFIKLAALGAQISFGKGAPGWLLAFITKLVKREPAVMRLIDDRRNPWLKGSRPRALRISLWEYFFAPPTGRSMREAISPEGLTDAQGDRGAEVVEPDPQAVEASLNESWQRGQWWIRQHFADVFEHQCATQSESAAARPARQDSSPTTTTTTHPGSGSGLMDMSPSMSMWQHGDMPHSGTCMPSRNSPERPERGETREAPHTGSGRQRRRRSHRDAD